MHIRNLHIYITKVIFITLFSLLLSASKSICQTADNEYTSLISKADSLYKQGNYLTSAHLYNQAFQNKNGYSMSYHRLFAAQAWNKAGYLDSALSNLYYLILTMRFDDTSELKKYFLNTRLYFNKEFKRIYNKAVCQSLLQKKKYDSSLAKLMEFVYESDQSTRSLKQQDLGKNGKKYFSQLESEKIVDSIYNKYGWLAPGQIGFRGSQAMFLIIQHGNLKLQLKWIKRVQQGVAGCYLTPECIALLTDRILVSKGKKQIYGTQLKWNDQTKQFQPLPINDISKVDFLRNKLGMIDMKSYLLIQNNGY